MLLYEDLSNIIIQSAIEVHRVLGKGFLEKVYENALYLELISRDLAVEKQKNIKVYYKNCEVGSYIADLIIDNKIIVELKSAKILDEAFSIQLLNYLTAVNLRLGLLINFGTGKLEIKRVVR